MVLRAPAEPALLVPDPESWLAWGDAESDDFAPATSAAATVLVAPERLPAALAEALREAWDLMAPGRRVERYEAPFGGATVAHALTAEPSDDDAGDLEDGGSGEDHDHEDMMAITGEPSADGLVMESMEIEAGPLGLGLPGGLVVAATLDGDVVASCEVRRLLAQPPGDLAPDPWGASAWAAAELASRERADSVEATAPERWLRLAGIETERAVSHLAWLHALARLLGWPGLADRVRPALAAARAVRPALPVELASPDLPGTGAAMAADRLLEARTAAEDLDRRLRGSRRFARRTEGLGVIEAGDARARGLQGPTARACGLAADARCDDPGYGALGFEPVLEAAGDARARALVRTAEVAQSCRLAAAAIERSRTATEPAPAFADGTTGVAEGPRGPQRVLLGGAGPERTAPGARAAARAAGELAAGHEWATALVVIASFDLSPWRVGA